MKPIRTVIIAPMLISLFSIVALAAERPTTPVELSIIRLKPQGEVLSVLSVVRVGTTTMTLRKVVSEQPLQLLTVRLPESATTLKILERREPHGGNAANQIFLITLTPPK